MTPAAAVLLLTLSGTPGVAVLQGSADGASPAAIKLLLDDAEAHLTAAGLSTARSEKQCGARASCFVDAAKEAGAQAMLIVSFFSGPSGLTVDLDAKSAAGDELDVLTTGVGAKGRLPASSEAFFAALAEKLTNSDRPVEVKLTPGGEPSIASAPFSPVKPLLISGGGLLVVSAALFVVALVLSNQLGGRLSSSGVITGITRAQAQSQASVANALATSSLLTGIAGCGLAAAGGIWGLFGAAPSSELVEER